MVNANNIDSTFSDWCDTAKEALSKEDLKTLNLPSCDISIYDLAWLNYDWPSDTDFSDANDYCDVNINSMDMDSIDFDNSCID